VKIQRQSDKVDGIYDLTVAVYSEFGGISKGGLKLSAPTEGEEKADTAIPEGRLRGETRRGADSPEKRSFMDAGPVCGKPESPRLFAEIT